jgi:hypothetical protein
MNSYIYCGIGILLIGFGVLGLKNYKNRTLNTISPLALICYTSWAVLDALISLYSSPTFIFFCEILAIRSIQIIGLLIGAIWLYKAIKTNVSEKKAGALNIIGSIFLIFFGLLSFLDLYLLHWLYLFAAAWSAG